MLDEYVTDLRKRLEDRRGIANKMAIDCGGDVYRSQVQAYDLAIADMGEILEQYREPEEVPEQLKIFDMPDTRSARPGRIGRRVA